MEKKMMMPACYNVMTEEEMTYTNGGAAPDLGGVVRATVGIVATALSIYNEVKVAPTIKSFVDQNKNNSFVGFVNSAVRDFTTYVRKDVESAVVGVYSAVNQGFWWPITAIYCILT